MKMGDVKGGVVFVSFRLQLRERRLKYQSKYEKMGDVKGIVVFVSFGL